MDHHHHHHCHHHHHHHGNNMNPETNHEHHQDSHHEHNNMSGMHMYFHLDAFTYLFKGWSSANAAGLAGALVLTLLLGVLLECIKVYLYSQHLSSASINNHRSIILSRTCHACLHSLRVVIGYSLMLIAMTFNIWLITCTVVGSALGYFLALPLINGYFWRSLLKRQKLQNTSPIYRRGENDRLMCGSSETPEVRSVLNPAPPEVIASCCDEIMDSSSEEIETDFTVDRVYRTSPMVTKIK